MKLNALKIAASLKNGESVTLKVEDLKEDISHIQEYYKDLGDEAPKCLTNFLSTDSIFEFSKAYFKLLCGFDRNLNIETLSNNFIKLY